jgi:molecular chaperone GrpE
MNDIDKAKEPDLKNEEKTGADCADKEKKATETESKNSDGNKESTAKSKTGGCGEKGNRQEEADDFREDNGLQEEAGSQPDELAILNDKYLRVLAEYDNYKKRTQKEKSDIYTIAVADVIEAILPVMDAICRAAEMEKDSEGILLIKKQLDDVLKQIGIEPINAVGETFDPQLHDAVAHVEDEKYDSNTVIEEYAKGYKYKEKVIRHSVVKVAN